ncbi:MAG: sigma-54-dependent Fis family transcriptional regulator [Halobacteria archaeon]|nr:sigma-54-dependent Fis family transcriptional regulator [Halobacteria archaeon]
MGKPVFQVADSELIAEDRRSRELVMLADRVAAAEVTVMLNGESGTGKELLARYIHRNSSRKHTPFVAINCAAIPENMLESLLFGYEKGAFTGAYQAHPGKFEQAQGGTLLLDEISEMDLGLQAKLLRVLQEREVERLGGRETIPLDVRVLASTNRKLRDDVNAGRFRQDLFYRLNVFPLNIPALRDRPGDILPLARQLIRRYGTAETGPLLSREAEQCLLSHSWPGNVRELENVMQRALILNNSDCIEAGDISLDEEEVHAGSLGEIQVDGVAKASRVLDQDLKKKERELIIQALEAGNGSRKDAAARLGISPRTLRYKIARLRDAGMELPGSAGAGSA